MLVIMASLQAHHSHPYAPHIPTLLSLRDTACIITNQQCIYCLYSCSEAKAYTPKTVRIGDPAFSESITVIMSRNIVRMTTRHSQDHNDEIGFEISGVGADK